jgi:hypothetical protein
MTMRRHGRVKHGSNKAQYCSTLIVFSSLSVVLLRYQKDNIPSHELVVAALFACGLGIRLLWVRIHRTWMLRGGGSPCATRAKPPFELPEQAVHIGQTLMLQEVIWTLLAPWLCLFLDHHHSNKLRMESFHQAVGYFVTPHLFFFQLQISLESFLQLTSTFNTAVAKSDTNDKRDFCSPFQLFWYTAGANAYRGIVVGVTLVRSLNALPDLHLFQHHNVYEFCVVIFLPIAMAVLWVYSTFIYLPIYWYPAIITGATE